MQLTQNRIDMLSKNLRNQRIKIELLDIYLKPIDSIEGVVIDGSLTANANSQIRRSGTMRIAIPINRGKNSFLDIVDGYVISPDGKIWIDKLLKIYVGIDNYFISPMETIWYKLGVFLINQPTMTYDSENYIISFDCVDQMIKFTGKRQGQLTGQTVIIPNVEYTYDSEDPTKIVSQQKIVTTDALRAVIQDIFNISKFTIYPISSTSSYYYLPYEIKVDVGSTCVNILSQFMDILSTWQAYFDLDGVFVIEPIPSGQNDVVYQLEKIQYNSIEQNYDFENVKNQIVVYGRLNSITYYTDNSSATNVIYDEVNSKLILKFDTLDINTLLIGATTIGFKSLNAYNPEFTTLEIYSGGSSVLSGSLKQFEGTTNSIDSDFLQPNEIYVLRVLDGTLNSSGDGYVDPTQTVTFEFYSKQQVAMTLVNDNLESPFYINNNIQGENYYAGLSYGLGDNYKLTLNNQNTLTELTNGTIITFMANQVNLENCTATIYQSNGNALIETGLPIVQNLFISGIRPPIVQNKLGADFTIYELKYDSINGYFILLGKHPYVITKVCNGGEYDNIYADQLAYERCLWELFNHSNMNDTINLDIIPNYLIDVNCRIPYDSNSANPQDVYRNAVFYVQETDPSNGNIQKFITRDGLVFFNVREETYDYYITKEITYPLGADNSAQRLNAIRIYDNDNLVGGIYDNI